MTIVESLNEMITETGLSLDDCIEFYHEFFNDMHTVTQDLPSYCEKEDYTRLSKDAHKLAGLFANLHLNEICEIASKVESAARICLDCSNLIALLILKCDLLNEELKCVTEINVE